MYLNQKKVKVNDLHVNFNEKEFEIILNINFENYPLLKKHLKSKENIIPSNYFDEFWGEIDKYLENNIKNDESKKLLIEISNYFSYSIQFMYE